MKPQIDFVFVGQTIPERRRKDPSVVQVCSAGYSPTLRQLVRIYPLPVSFGGHRWENYMIPIERNPKDSRKESFKISSEKRKISLDLVTDDIVFLQKEDRSKCITDLAKMATPSIAELNTCRRSLGIIKPKNLEGYWASNPEHAPLFERSDLFEKTEKEITKKGREHWARLRFSDDSGFHDLMLNSWDVYEWHRRHSEKHPLSDVWLKLQIGNPEYEHLLLIGNMAAIRNRWLVIAVIAYKKPIQVDEKQFDLFGGIT